IALFYSIWFLIKDYIKIDKLNIVVPLILVLMLCLFYFPTMSEIFHTIGFGGFSIIAGFVVIPLIVGSLLVNDSVDAFKTYKKELLKFIYCVI
ncbi:MAG: hypothetical protein LBV51_00335, partial [Acholeplasmatales bacterium]|nr:hypothetical protein [Acholeplasmatales bacterium]